MPRVFSCRGEETFEVGAYRIYATRGAEPHLVEFLVSGVGDPRSYALRQDQWLRLGRGDLIMLHLREVKKGRFEVCILAPENMRIRLARPESSVPLTVFVGATDGKPRILIEAADSLAALREAAARFNRDLPACNVRLLEEVLETERAYLHA